MDTLQFFKLAYKDTIVTAGGVIPPQDYDYLYEQGVAFIFGPGTVIPDAAKKLMEQLIKQYS